MEIKNFEGLYDAMPDGSIKSVDRIVEAKNRWGGVRKMLIKGKPIKQYIGKNGYLHVTLSKNGKQYTFDSHRLIYEAFYGKIPENIQVNHKNEIKTDNRINNLELLTPKENTNYGTGIERMSKNKSKIVYQYTTKNELVAVYESTKQAAIENGYDQATISACARGKKNCYTYKGYKWSYIPL